MTELPIQSLLLSAISVIDRLGIPYAVMGGFAVRIWGVPRPTYDADIAVAVDEDGLLRLLSGLADAGFDVPEEHRKGFRDAVAGMEKVRATRFAEGSAWEIDLFVAAGGLLQSALSRRRSRTIEGKDIWVMSPEDIILLKLVAYRRKDQLDVEEILQVTPDVDRGYLTSWASRLGVAARLREFLPPA